MRSGRSRLALLLVPILLAACAFPALAAKRKSRKASPLAKVLSYHTGMVEPVLHRDLPIARIETLSGFHRSAAWQNPGLTIGEHELRTDFQVGGSQDARGVSAWVETLDVVFRYTSLDVYVASDYADGSCEERQISRHERDHVAVHRQVYASYVRRLKSGLLALDLPTPSHPRRYGSLSEAQRRIAESLRAVTQGTYGRFKRDLAVGNDRLDTPARYRAIQARCKGWK